jgi:hypothetical protein
LCCYQSAVGSDKYQGCDCDSLHCHIPFNSAI